MGKISAAEKEEIAINWIKAIEFVRSYFVHVLEDENNFRFSSHCCSKITFVCHQPTQDTASKTYWLQKSGVERRFERPFINTMKVTQINLSFFSSKYGFIRTLRNNSIMHDSVFDLPLLHLRSCKCHIVIFCVIVSLKLI